MPSWRVQAFTAHRVYRAKKLPFLSIMSVLRTAFALTLVFTIFSKGLAIINRRAQLDPALMAASYGVPGDFHDWQNWSELLVLRNRPADKDFVFCSLPKNGCSVWKQAFLRAMDIADWNTTDKTRIHNPWQSSLDLVGVGADGSENMSDIRALMGPHSTSFKAVLVRDPITRFLSSFLDRCVDNKEWWRCRTRPHASLEDVVSAYEARGDDAADIHFKNQSHFCGLQYKNYTHYDMIQYYEDFVNAGRKLLHAARLWRKVGASGWGVNGTSAFGIVEQVMSNHVSQHSTDQLVCQYYTIPLLQRVRALYEPDFEQFGYTTDHWFRACAQAWEI